MDPAQLPNAVTERVTIPVKGGAEDWKEQLQYMLQALGRQPGYLRTRWGPWTEDQQKLELLTGWTDVEANEKWMKSKDYTDTMATLAPVLDGQPSSYLLRFMPHAPQAVIDSPIVETVTFEDFNEPPEKMREVVERAARIPGCNGVASGYSLQCPANSGREDGRDNVGRTFFAAIGWINLEASRAADKSAYTGGMKAESHHVDFSFPVKGFGRL
ncbi:hypothetical protein CCHL11_06730 [Colletotrichum chlorophyti]|uniref:ABM domain-containing protein n=1 Tax=Colletotrichum chlorophyti TaxID=708187 RepID=A0A1Q8RZ43_9PEZI|nr:hypothetical protein CCHL11_06730 [Colletotrichum chlorophyti]